MKKVILALVFGLSAVSAKSIMVTVDLDKIIDSKEFAEMVGNEVSFSFGSGSTEKVFATNLKSRHDVRQEQNDKFQKSLSGKVYDFSEVDKRCGFALLKSLEKLKEQVLEIGGKKAVNIISYYTSSTQLDSKDTFQCIIRKARTTVKLKAEVAK